MHHSVPRSQPLQNHVLKVFWVVRDLPKKTKNKSKRVLQSVAESVSHSGCLLPVKDSLLVVHWVSWFFQSSNFLAFLWVTEQQCVLVYTKIARSLLLLTSSCRLVVKGYRSPLAAEDLWTLREEDTSHKIISELQKEWTTECAKIQK